jgi:ankyrin repeat protein
MDIHEATRQGNLALLQSLLANGTDVNNTQNNSGSAPLHYAIYNGGDIVAELLVAEFLVAHGVDVNKQNNDGLTPLHLAIYNGPYTMDELLVTEFLVAHGADVNKQDNDGFTPLHYAIDMGHNTVAEFLVTNGADIHLCNKNKQSPWNLIEEYKLHAFCVPLSKRSLRLCTILQLRKIKYIVDTTRLPPHIQDELLQ